MRISVSFSCGVRTKVWVTASWCASAKYACSQRASSAVSRTTSGNGSELTYAAAAFCPKLGPTHRSGTSPCSCSARSAEAIEFTRKAIWVASE